MNLRTKLESIFGKISDSQFREVEGIIFDIAEHYDIKHNNRKNFSDSEVLDMIKSGKGIPKLN